MTMVTVFSSGVFADFLFPPVKVFTIAEKRLVPIRMRSASHSRAITIKRNIPMTLPTAMNMRERSVYGVMFSGEGGGGLALIAPPAAAVSDEGMMGGLSHVPLAPCMASAPRR